MNNEKLFLVKIVHSELTTLILEQLALYELSGDQGYKKRADYFQSFIASSGHVAVPPVETTPSASDGQST